LNQWLHGSSFLFPAVLILKLGRLEEAKSPAETKVLRLIQVPSSGLEFGKNYASVSSKKAATTNRCIEPHNCDCLFIGVYNEALPIVALCIGHKDRSSFRINGCDPTQAPAAFLKIVSDYFAVPHQR
jgi:hypothetical protein